MAATLPPSRTDRRSRVKQRKDAADGLAGLQLPRDERPAPAQQNIALFIGVPASFGHPPSRALKIADRGSGVVHALSMVPIPFDPGGAVGKEWATPTRRRKGRCSVTTAKSNLSTTVSCPAAPSWKRAMFPTAAVTASRRLRDAIRSAWGSLSRTPPSQGRRSPTAAAGLSTLCPWCRSPSIQEARWAKGGQPQLGIKKGDVLSPESHGLDGIGGELLVTHAPPVGVRTQRAVSRRPLSAMC